MSLVVGGNLMSDFNPNVAEMFMYKWQADFYAWRAKKKGFIPIIEGPYDNWIELGGKWEVTLTDPTKQILNDLIEDLSDVREKSSTTTKKQTVDEFSRPIINFNPPSCREK